MTSELLLSDILTATQGTIISQVTTSFRSVGTDTRQPLRNQLFVALKGDAFDAHNYLPQAVDAGATGLLIHYWDQKLEPLKSKVTIVLVSDTLMALQNLGRLRRRQWGKSIIAITGSNGKTTSKEFAAQILSQYKTVHYNQGSFNNHWGVPLTLLGLQPEHEIAICEMGMNHPGEIATLVSLAEPNIVGVTMVGRAHLEGLGSLEAVASAKSEIYFTPNPRLTSGIFNLDGIWTKEMYNKFSTRNNANFTFSATTESCNVHLSIVSATLEHLHVKGSISGVQGEVVVPIFGKQNLTNLMFAACAALSVGITPKQIWKALPLCKTSWGRNQKISHPSGADFLFDGYNANPESQKALIENLQILKIDRPLIGVFGDMRELGANSSALHEELGQLASSVPFSAIFFIGSHGKDFARGFSNLTTPLYLYSEVMPSMTSKLEQLLSTRPLVTIKGSRGVKLEKILQALSTAPT